jgi:plastocyanin
VWRLLVPDISSLLLSAALLAGCAGVSPSGPVATDHVDLPRSYRFDPPAIRVSLGTAVTWTNHDQFTHSVHLPDGTQLMLRPGASSTHAFSRPGRYPYDCSLHPHDMRGIVIVEAGG